MTRKTSNIIARCVSVFALAFFVADPVLAGPKPAKVADGQAAQNLLRRMLQAESVLTLTGTQTTILSRSGKDVTTQQHLVRDGDRRMRLDYQRGGRAGKAQIVDDGARFWRFNPSAKTLETGPSRLKRLRARIPQVLAQIKRGALSARVVGHENVAGRDCAIVEVAPSAMPTGPRRRFWIDSANGAQLKIEQYDAQGQRLSSSFFTDVTYSPTLAPGTFAAPRTPADVRAVAPMSPQPASSLADAQTQAGFAAATPTYLPPGFVFQSAAVEVFQRRNMLTLRYANGLSTLSLSETPGIGPARTRIMRPAGGSIAVIAAKSGLRVVLVGSLEAGELQKVVDSIR